MRNTITEYNPMLRVPSSARNPPHTRVAVNPTRMAIRMSGVNAAEMRIAALLAAR